MAWPENRNRYREGFPDCLDSFRQLPDPRESPATRHYFGEILFIALAATISGMDGFEDIAVFSRERKDWLGEHLELPNGLPSADTYARVFAAIDPQAFMDCFTAMVASHCPALAGELIAIDGLYKVADEIGPEWRKKPVMAWLEHDIVKIKSFD